MRRARRREARLHKRAGQAGARRGVSDAGSRATTSTARTARRHAACRMVGRPLAPARLSRVCSRPGQEMATCMAHTRSLQCRLTCCPSCSSDAVSAGASTSTSARKDARSLCGVYLRSPLPHTGINTVQIRIRKRTQNPHTRCLGKTWKSGEDGAQSHTRRAACRFVGHMRNTLATELARTNFDVTRTSVAASVGRPMHPGAARMLALRRPD